MGWDIGYDENWKRWIGYGVPAYCDQPTCRSVIDRGLSYVCGGEPYGGEHGCGLFFCEKHRHFGPHAEICARCLAYKKPYKRIKPEHPRWIRHLLYDETWLEWRRENPGQVMAFKEMLKR